jgi:hypothetical protein
LQAIKVSNEMAAEVMLETPPPKRFITKEMAEAFKKTDEALALFEKQDPNSKIFGYIS